MAETMETEMEFSDGEQTNANAHVTGLLAVYGNSSIEKGIEKRQNHEELPGFIFMCNGKTKVDCYRYRVFGIPRTRIDIVESIKPGMKLFLFDFEKKLLYGVYEATIGGKLNIEPEAFEMKYPAQVGFRIAKNCYPIPESTFKSAIIENYNGAKFKQELTPHQVMSLLSLFRTFSAPELDSLSHRLASRASAPRNLSFEERFIAATQLRNASSVLDPLSVRQAEAQLSSLLAHQSIPHSSLLQHGYSRQDNYTTPPREALSLSNLNQLYHPTENRQQRLPRDPSRSSIQDPQLKYLTILSNIRRYGSVSENEYYPATPSEKDQFTSPYSDNKYYPSMLSGNEHPSASAANGHVYKSEFYTSASQQEGETSQLHEIPAGAFNAAQSRTETADHPTPIQSETVGNAQQLAAKAIGYTHQPQSVAVNYSAQPGSVEESTQAYANYTQQQYYAALGHTSQLYANATGFIQQPHETGYAQQPQAAATGYAQQPHETGYPQQPQAAATGYTQQLHETGYGQATATGYTQQPQAEATGYVYATATGYTQQAGAATGYALQQPYAQGVEYTPQYHTQAVGYTQQAVPQGYIPGPPGTTDWNAAYQSYYSQSADATTSYNKTS